MFWYTHHGVVLPSGVDHSGLTEARLSVFRRTPCGLTDSRGRRWKWDEGRGVWFRWTSEGEVVIFLFTEVLGSTHQAMISTSPFAAGRVGFARFRPLKGSFMDEGGRTWFAVRAGAVPHRWNLTERREEFLVHGTEIYAEGSVIPVSVGMVPSSMRPTRAPALRADCSEEAARVLKGGAWVWACDFGTAEQPTKEDNDEN